MRERNTLMRAAILQCDDFARRRPHQNYRLVQQAQGERLRLNRRRAFNDKPRIVHQSLAGRRKVKDLFGVELDRGAAEAQRHVGTGSP